MSKSKSRVEYEGFVEHAIACVHEKWNPPVVGMSEILHMPHHGVKKSAAIIVRTMERLRYLIGECVIIWELKATADEAAGFLREIIDDYDDAEEDDGDDEESSDGI